jgi:hypothetical protein|tara:strand:- start:1541 stop:1792 length:252 start_codon:yes stop_codon:yes gene_type:complete
MIDEKEALKFAGTVRGQYIISQALVMAIRELKRYENGETDDIRYAEPSNRSDMEFLLDVFPLYKVCDEMQNKVDQQSFEDKGR